MVAADGNNETDRADAASENLVLPPSIGRADIHAAWLSAGERSDVATMRQLLSQFPEWLDLQQSAGPSDSTQGHTQFCSWDGFHLSTLGASALHTAAWEGDLAVMALLLEFGQYPDSGDDGGLTPMMVAILRLNLMTTRCVFRGGEAVRRNLVVDCREEQSERLKQVVAVMELLVRFGADVNARSQEGKTALHWSTGDDAYEVANLLLDAGTDANAQDENGKTPLHYCVQEGGLNVVNLLLSHGASIDVADADGITPLQLVVQRADLNALQLFLNHHQWVSTPQRQDFAGSVLLQAVDTDSEAVVRFVVEYGYAPVTVRNAKGETPMHRAILRRNPSVMELLSDLDLAGESMSAVTTTMEMPAHYAALHGSAREVETMLLCLTRALGDLEELEELGATNPLNTADQSGRTSLYIAGTTPTSGTNGFDANNGGNNLKDRNAKARLLLNHGGRLFPDGFLIQALASSSFPSHCVILPDQVQRCLGGWLAEVGSYREEPEDEEMAPASDDAHSMETVVDLCMQWITCATFFLGTSVTLVAVVTCAGYAHEVLPLLLDLPLHRREFPTFLRGLQKFAAHREPSPGLLLQLHAELSRAWHEVAARS